MTILAILVAFALCHFVRDLAKIRHYEWVGHYANWSNRNLSNLPAWDGMLGFVLLIALPLLAIGLIDLLLFNLLGSLGHFLLAIAVLIYCFGPRDLDLDVAEVVQASNADRQAEALADLTSEPLPEDDEAKHQRLTELVFQEGLRRWFGIIFWFALLGIFGALLFRLADLLSRNQNSETSELNQLLVRLRQVLEWPVAQLMTLALAIATDFDSVFKSWKHFHDEQGHSLFEGDNGFLLAAAQSAVHNGQAAEDGYADLLTGPEACMQLAMDLVWRMLFVWLTVLALMLLVDWIA